MKLLKVECYLKFLVRLLLSGLVHIGNFFLQMNNEIDYERITRRRKLFLDYAMKAIKFFLAGTVAN